MKRLVTFPLVVFLMLPLWHCSTGRSGVYGGGGLVRPTDAKGTAPPDTGTPILRETNVTIDPQQISASRNTLEFTALGRNFAIVRERVEEIRDKGLIWYGKLRGEKGSSAIFVRIGETVTADIDTAAGEAFQIRYAGDGVHSFRQIDRSKFPDEAKPLPAVKRSGPFAAADTCATDPPSDIDVLVAYTAAARTGAGGTSAMEGAVYLAVAETNQSYINSGIAQRLRLVHVVEVAYTESGDFFVDLPRLQNGGDTFMDNVPTLRNTFAADAVSLITETGNACGLGYFMDTVSNTFENSAYSVVARSCATGYFSYGHELGHNMGADHDAPNASATGAFPYNRGWTETTPTSPATPWRTIMAYQTSPASTRVQYWSNPGVAYPVGGDVMGDAATADNHRVLNDTALTVANFRCSSPSAPNVWMKDTWNDTGLEPDPNTASDPMWISPYIWNRLAQDTGLVNQHMHQNPEFGSTNWAYVKLHNGGSAAASGSLELYIANASASLTWPGAWTMLASIPVGSFAAHSSRVVEASWAPPGTGHYCMIARWNSAADPMTTAEGPDINANVRANNNLVWRNLNIVNLTPDASGDVEMNVANVDREMTATTLVIGPGKGRNLTSFFGAGETTVELDALLLDAWQRGGSRGFGFKREGNRFRITSAEGARFENLQLPPKQQGRLKLTFRRLPSTPKTVFRVDVEQRRTPDYSYKYRMPEVVGGVSYEIHTDR